jgi:hypothetical protein
VRGSFGWEFVLLGRGGGLGATGIPSAATSERRGNVAGLKVQQWRPAFEVERACSLRPLLEFSSREFAQLRILRAGLFSR